jgi:hypothetical protein
LMKRLGEYRRNNSIFAVIESILCSYAGKAQTFGS